MHASRNSQHHPHWPLPAFLRVNQRISLVWAISFALMTLADGAVAFVSLPLYVGIAVSVVALTGAVTFTLLYPALAAERLSR